MLHQFAETQDYFPLHANFAGDVFIAQTITCLNFEMLLSESDRISVSRSRALYNLDSLQRFHSIVCEPFVDTGENRHYNIKNQGDVICRFVEKLFFCS